MPGLARGYLLTGRHGYSPATRRSPASSARCSPARQVARGVRPHPWRRPIASLNYLLVARLAADTTGSATRTGASSTTWSTEGRGRARVPAARRQYTLRHRPLPAQPGLRQRRRRGQAARPAVADDGQGDPALPPASESGNGPAAIGAKGRRGGVLWRRAHARDARRRRSPPPARAGAPRPGRQRGEPHEAAARDRARTALRPRLRRPLHEGQADPLRLRLPVAHPPPDPGAPVTPTSVRGYKEEAATARRSTCA